MTGIGLPDLVAEAYESACDLKGLQGWVNHLNEYFGSDGAALIIWPSKNDDDLNLITAGLSPDELRAQFENRHQSDSLFGRLAVLAPAETCIIADVFSDATPGSPDEESSPTQQHALAGVVIADEAHRCCLTLFRSGGQGEFSRSESDSLQVLMGYFERAVVLNRRFIDIFTQQKTLAAVLNSAPRGIITCGQNGQVTYVNNEARRIFSLADGVSLANKMVNFRDGHLRDQFSDFIEQARQTGDVPEKQERMSTIIERDSVSVPFQMMAYALPFNQGQAALFEDEALAVLIIQDATTNLQLRSELLQTFYNLTAAEARLAVALYKGKTLPEAADGLHISVNTARSQLRGIFKKVGVNSQSTLLQALTSGAKDLETSSDSLSL
jgi:DNA-binding CsgD family transcriptional regulator/PAS domain-containing protein